MLRSMIERSDSMENTPCEELNKSNVGDFNNYVRSPRSVNKVNGSFDESDIIGKSFLLQKPLLNRGNSTMKPRYCMFCTVLFYQEYCPDSTDKFCSKDCKACSVVAPRHLNMTGKKS